MGRLTIKSLQRGEGTVVKSLVMDSRLRHSEMGQGAQSRCALYLEMEKFIILGEDRPQPGWSQIQKLLRRNGGARLGGPPASSYSPAWTYYDDIQL